MDPLHKGDTALPINPPNQSEDNTMVKPSKPKATMIFHNSYQEFKQWQALNASCHF